MVAEVDQKYLGIFAKETSENNPELSAALYKVLGLSTLLNRKLVRARKQRKLDPTRPTKSLDLYKHINWMGREGYSIVETIIPHVENYVELRVLVYKLKASFLHVFVLFEFSPNTKVNVLSNIYQQQANGATPTLKEVNYIKPAMEAFKRAYDLAAELLPGIHPLRLSVIVEYSAFMFDCVKDYEESRRLAKQGVDDALEVVDAIEDDETFDEARDLVGSLAIMAKRVSPPLHASPNMAHAASHGDLRNKNKTTYDLDGNVLMP
ncbi:14-3-3 domain-containing protein [Kalaharituber pfeilii]|nr:14-3-3 domain-containing protein [Kalaharituber pfeilii]